MLNLRNDCIHTEQGVCLAATIASLDHAYHCGSYELYVKASFYAYSMLLPPDPGFLTADRHHPVFSGCSVPVHLQLLANCGAAEHCVLPGRAYGVCCIHLPSLQGAWSLQVLVVSRGLLLHHCKAC